jgi:hypothetical protein
MSFRKATASLPNARPFAGSNRVATLGDMTSLSDAGGDNLGTGGLHGGEGRDERLE